MAAKKTKDRGAPSGAPGIERKPDPTGLLPDSVHVDLSDAAVHDAATAIGEVLRSNTPRGRIERIAALPELADIAESLRIRLGPNGNAADSLLLDIADAERRALYMGAAPDLIRDRRRQAGTRRSRGSRMPGLDAWLDSQLQANPNATNEALFHNLPTPDSDFDIYRDGNKVVEINRKGEEHSITRSGFDKRATTARKRRE